MTQGLLTTIVADCALPALRGAASGFFHLFGGLTMLISSTLAGLLWDRIGAAATFYTGALFCSFALAAVVIQVSGKTSPRVPTS